MSLHFVIFFFMARQPLVGQGLLIIETSRSHSDTPHSVGLLWTSDRPIAKTSIHAPGGTRTRNPRKWAAADPRLRPRGHREWPFCHVSAVKPWYSATVCSSQMVEAHREWRSVEILYNREILFADFHGRWGWLCIDVWLYYCVRWDDFDEYITLNLKDFGGRVWRWKMQDATCRTEYNVIRENRHVTAHRPLPPTLLNFQQLCFVPCSIGTRKRDYKCLLYLVWFHHYFGALDFRHFLNSWDWNRVQYYRYSSSLLYECHTYIL